MPGPFLQIAQRAWPLKMAVSFLTLGRARVGNDGARDDNRRRRTVLVESVERAGRRFSYGCRLRTSGSLLLFYYSLLESGGARDARPVPGILAIAENERGSEALDIEITLASCP
jgi:hypothetical protein